MQDATAIIGLMTTPGIGTARIHRILASLEDRCVDPQYLLEYDAESLVHEELQSAEQASHYTSDAQRTWRSDAVDQLIASNVHLLPITSAAYPGHLRAGAPVLAPPLLMVKGRHELLRLPGVAFAGARRSSTEGLEITRTLVALAVDKRFTVVSGGARGADTATHEEAISQGGSTIIVLPEGIRSPRARLIADRLDGVSMAVVSTFLPDSEWQQWRAMERNRYILGMCDRLVVIEAGTRGGTLAAGKEALEHGIDTWVLDYATPPESALGNTTLLELGANPIPVTSEGEITIPPALFAIDEWAVVEVRG